MANERYTNPPPGDADLTDLGRPERGETIVSGGVGPSGSGFASTGKTGGMGNTSDGAERRLDTDDSAEGDHTRGSGMVEDANAGSDAAKRAS